MASISIALSKGRIFDETAPLLARVGIRPKENPETSRKLVIGTNRRDLRLVVVRASDTPTYVQHGGADLGIAGRDVLAEHGGAGLYQPVDLGIAACRMMVAVRRGLDYRAAVRQGARLRIATKYVNNQTSQGIERTRPLCPYPAVARWDGKGDPAAAESFVCAPRRIDLGRHP